MAPPAPDAWIILNTMSFSPHATELKCRSPCILVCSSHSSTNCSSTISPTACLRASFRSWRVSPACSAPACSIVIKNLKFAFLEGGISWVPAHVERMDDHFENPRYGAKDLLSHPPSDYFKSGRIFFGCEGNESLLCRRSSAKSARISSCILPTIPTPTAAKALRRCSRIAAISPRGAQETVRGQRPPFLQLACSCSSRTCDGEESQTNRALFRFR